MAEVSLNKSMCFPFLQTGMSTGSDPQPIWSRIDKSTIFELSLNPQSTTEDYIAYESPMTTIDHYEPELPQEIITNEGNPIYDFIFDRLFNLPKGEGNKCPILICFPGSTVKKAWLVQDNVIELGAFNAVDKKITWTNKLGGNIVKGTYVISSAGVPTFTPDDDT